MTSLCCATGHLLQVWSKIFSSVILFKNIILYYIIVSLYRFKALMLCTCVDDNFIFYDLIVFILIYSYSCETSSRTDVAVLRSFICFKFWGGKQDLSQMCCWLYLSGYIQGRVVDSYRYCFFYGSSFTVPLLAYYLEVLHCCWVASRVLVFIDWWKYFQLFSISLFKCTGWLPYIFIIMLSLATLNLVYDITLFC